MNESPQLAGACVDMLIWTTEGADIPLGVILTLNFFHNFSKIVGIFECINGQNLITYFLGASKTGGKHIKGRARQVHIGE